MPAEPPQPQHTTPPAVPDTPIRVLAEAAATARYAPSIHNTQPWRWRLTDDTLDLYAEPARILAVTDPDTRLATVSCGAALHHARLSLAAQGRAAQVTPLPEPDDPDLLARVRLGDPVPADPRAVRLAQAVPLRRTDRRPVTGPPLALGVLAEITAAVQEQGCWLHQLRPAQVLDLAVAAAQAQRAEAQDPDWQHELAYWAGGTRAAGTGVPGAAIPQEPPQTTVPGRDFGHPGELPPSAGHDHGAVFTVLYGPGDQRADWLCAGQALSAGWLTATVLGASVLPLSAAVEVTATRLVLRGLVSGIGHPYLVLRLGAVPADAAELPRVPRLSPAEIIDRG